MRDPVWKPHAYLFKVVNPAALEAAFFSTLENAQKFAQECGGELINPCDDSGLFFLCNVCLESCRRYGNGWIHDASRCQCIFLPKIKEG